MYESTYGDGVNVGRQEGIEKGREEGMQIATKTIALNLAAQGVDTQTIVTANGLPLESVLQLLPDRAN